MHVVLEYERSNLSLVRRPIRSSVLQVTGTDVQGLQLSRTPDRHRRTRNQRPEFVKK